MIVFMFKIYELLRVNAIVRYFLDNREHIDFTHPYKYYSKAIFLLDFINSNECQALSEKQLRKKCRHFLRTGIRGTFENFEWSRGFQLWERQMFICGSAFITYRTKALLTRYIYFKENLKRRQTGFCLFNPTKDMIGWTDKDLYLDRTKEEYEAIYQQYHGMMPFWIKPVEIFETQDGEPVNNEGSHRIDYAYRNSKKIMVLRFACYRRKRGKR